MSDLPTREDFDNMQPLDMMGVGVSIANAWADGYLRTEQEWRDSLESGHVILVAGHRKVKGPGGMQWELTGHSDTKWPLEYGKRFALVELPLVLGEQS